MAFGGCTAASAGKGPRWNTLRHTSNCKSRPIAPTHNCLQNLPSCLQPCELVTHSRWLTRAFIPHAYHLTPPPSPPNTHTHTHLT